MPSFLPRRASLCAGLLILMFALTAGAGDPPAKRRPVPDKAAVAAALKDVSDIFKEDFEGAKTPEAKAKLAASLLQQARDNRKDDLPASYALFRVGRDLAAAAGDYVLALQAVEEMTAEFDLPALDLKAEALARAGEALTDEELNKGLVDAALRLLAEAVDADNYTAADTLAQVAEVAAKRSKVIALVNAVRKRNQEVAAVRKGFERLQPYIDRLKKDPKDAEANFKLGEYYGLLKNKWERALPLLALGDDAAIREQAKRDLARPTDGKAQLAVADGWWDLAEKQKDPAKLHMLRRAAHWYQEAAASLTGLSRTRALKRSDRVAALVQGTEPVVVKKGPVGPIRTFEGHTSEVRGVAFTPDGRYGVSGGKDESVRVWDLVGGKEFKLLKGHTKEVWSVAAHPNGRQALSASWDATVRLWDLTGGKEVRAFRHPVDVNGVAISRDGRWMLTGCDDRSIRLWDLTTGQEVRKYGGFEGYVYGVAFSPDGKHVAAGSQDRTVRVFDLKTGQKVREFTGHSAATHAVTFTSDGRHVISCGDAAARMWEVATGKEVRRFEVPNSTSYVLGLALSPDGRRLLTGHEDKTVRLWDVATGKELSRFEGHTDQVQCVAFSADGGQALSGSTDRTVRLWGLPR